MKKKNIISKEEKEFLEQYDVTKFERPSVTADIVIFTLDSSDELNILLIKDCILGKYKPVIQSIDIL